MSYREVCEIAFRRMDWPWELAFTINECTAMHAYLKHGTITAAAKSVRRSPTSIRAALQRVKRQVY